MRILLLTLFSAIFITYFTLPLYGYSQMPEYLCEIGIKFYQQGRYDEALNEFKKAIQIQPDYTPALRYIQMVEEIKSAKKKEGISPVITRPSQALFNQSVKESLDLIELQKEMISLKQAAPAGLTQALLTSKTLTTMPEVAAKTAILKEVLNLDASFARLAQPIEIEKGKSIIVAGKNIQRFLVTQPDILSAERVNINQIILTGKDIGYSYVYFWDEQGRWAVEFLGVPSKPEGPTLDELMRRQEERQEAFKIRYNLEWHLYELGRRLDNLKRQYYSWSHNLNLNAPTPYGDLDSTAIIRKLQEASDLTYFTLGFSNGSWNDFQGFSLRAFDFYPEIYKLIFSGAASDLRGLVFESPAFNKKMNYTVFWGREGGGRYGNLSPGLEKIKRSYLNGLDINFSPLEELRYGFTFLHGYGQDRLDYLNPYGYDAYADWRLGNWDMGFEMGYDSQTFAHLLSGSYHQPLFNFTYELRDVSKNFLAINGEPWRRGQLGGLFSLNCLLNQQWNISNRLDVYQDRLFPASDNSGRWNQDYDLNVLYTLDPTASLKLDYSLQNDLGMLSQRRYQASRIGVNKSFNLIRTINTYLDYGHKENKDYTARQFDYINENISAGIRFSLIGQLYYFLNKQWNWLEARYTSEHFMPQVLETGIDFSSQILNTPFYENLRFTYRDEEDAGSDLSFLAGEDYIEGYQELSYKPTPDKEIYCSARVRNVWADNPNAAKRLEADFYTGMRYLWNTGLRWESSGNIDGYVFKDINADGLRQRDEAPVQGIKIWLGKDRSTTTDIFGYYNFKKVKGRKAFISLDARTLPGGFVLTVPQTQEIPILHGRTSRADFGIITRSEIYGFVFLDTDGDGKYSHADTGIKNVVLYLENGLKASTDSDGRYLFRNVSVGEHTITLDLNSLPLNYLPNVPLIKKISLSEGMAYVYNIPLRKARE